MCGGRNRVIYHPVNQPKSQQLNFLIGNTTSNPRDHSLKICTFPRCYCFQFLCLFVECLYHVSLFFIFVLFQKFNMQKSIIDNYLRFVATSTRVIDFYNKKRQFCFHRNASHYIAECRFIKRILTKFSPDTNMFFCNIFYTQININNNKRKSGKFIISSYNWFLRGTVLEGCARSNPNILFHCLLICQNQQGRTRWKTSYFSFYRDNVRYH